MELERPLLYDELKNEVFIEEDRKNKNNNLMKIIIGTIVIGIIGLFIWANDSYKPQELAKEALISDNTVEVKIDKFISFTPKNIEATKGFIFYPGAKVEPESYAPLCRRIAEQGYEVVIVNMPMNLAIFSYNRGEKVIDEYSNIKKWVVGGHSLGGTMAAKFASENSAVDGVVLLSSYPIGDELKSMGKEVLSIWGSKDGIVNFEKLIKSKEKLPEDTTYVEIEGANHSQFGDYGEQRGDDTPIINREEQMDIAAKDIIKFMSAIK
ncbi:alpha/beta hydrolase [Romboutsia ilealis]|uniref:Alpha/beta hydrolase n=2 Tax=Romboutsia faecis TaxID=2764597 RepID=A0ABR7JKR7_9FIRM|nr:alpha/beta hydrolase [Romboutsia faecis]MRN23721.1 alpha/beta hydrolase [Romboutsia ilealis]